MEPPENEPQVAPSRWAGLGTRAASSVVLAALFFFAWSEGGWIFTLLIMMAAMLMVKEWNALTEKDEALWRLAGMFYAAIPCASLIWLRDLGKDGSPMILYLVLVVCATDIGAYFVGRTFGQRKLVPTISPGKTWEGLGGGVVCAAVAGIVSQLFLPDQVTLLTGTGLAIVLALLAQAGDLLESWMKRRAGVKDSGTLIPGHGGLLDRVDGLVFTAPVVALAVYML